jgi:DNA-binding CsgD family transcriptional regulator
LLRKLRPGGQIFLDLGAFQGYFNTYFYGLAGQENRVEHLTGKDLRAVLEFLQGCYRMQDLDGFVGRVISKLSKLVPAEATVYTEFNHRRNRVFWKQEPADFAFPGSERIWERYSHEHPFVDHFRRTKDGRAVKFSDFGSQRQFHRTNLYNEFFRPLNIRHQMTFLLQEPTGLLVAIALNRATKDFSERERSLLNLLRPHLVQAYQNAEAVNELQQELARVRGALERLDRGVVFLSGERKVIAMTDLARERLIRFFETERRSADRLPEMLEGWLKNLDQTDKFLAPRPILVVEQDGKRLEVRLVSEPDTNLLVLDEYSTKFDPSVLQHLGLTRREAEVLCWVARGRTSGEIGLIIGARPRTVEKHVEKIFQKLGVETRTAAAAIALQALGRISRAL